MLLLAVEERGSADRDEGAESDDVDDEDTPSLPSPFAMCRTVTGWEDSHSTLLLRRG
jgi:hypothetical protein